MEQHLLLVRIWYTNESTIGMLILNNKFECYTLEDQVRLGEKVYGRTAIPSGTYMVIINESPKLKKLTPRLLAVPNFEGVLIHTLNTADETEGCIGVGCDKYVNKIGRSKIAFDRLMSKLKIDDKIKITIIDNEEEIKR